jgi:16S rRNA (guanine(1405)-N(7))-methyltransferase
VSDDASRLADRVMSARHYRGFQPDLVLRVAREELARAASETEAVKRVKRRLHQVAGAYRAQPRATDDPLAEIRAAWTDDLTDAAFQAACRRVLERHASTRERLPYLADFYKGIWRLTDGPPSALLDLGCGLGPLALPWMDLSRSAQYVAVDADVAALTTVDGFLETVRQPHDTKPLDLAVVLPTTAANVALLLKLVPILDQQDPLASRRLLNGLRARHAVVSFPIRSLGGRGKGMERTYRRRFEELVAASRRVIEVAEASISNELVFVVTLGEAQGG